MQNGTHSAEHTLLLTNRGTAVLTGVEDVDCFNEQIIILRTSQGMLTLTGEGLNISELNLENGRLIVQGEIASAEYSEQRKNGRSGFFGKLLR